MDGYRYTLFDSNPVTSGDCALPGHDYVALEAADAADAERQVRDVLTGMTGEIHFLIWDGGQVVAEGKQGEKR